MPPRVDAARRRRAPAGRARGRHRAADSPHRAVGRAAALLLLLAFAGGVARAMSRGQAPDCHCFGQIHSEPAGPSTLIRNAVLAVDGGVGRRRGSGAEPSTAASRAFTEPRSRSWPSRCSPRCSRSRSRSCGRTGGAFAPSWRRDDLGPGRPRTASRHPGARVRPRSRARDGPLAHGADRAATTVGARFRQHRLRPVPRDAAVARPLAGFALEAR